MGRKAKPAALKEAQGNPGKRPIAAEPPADDAQEAPRLGAPPQLSKDARKVWDRVAPELSRLKFLRDTDREPFARYCEWLVKWWQIERKLRRQQLVITTKSAHVEMDRLNKFLQAQLLIEKRLESLEDRYGLTPRARYQIMAQLANRPPELPLPPAGAEQTEQPQLPATASSPIGCLTSPKSVH